MDISLRLSALLWVLLVISGSFAQIKVVQSTYIHQLFVQPLITKLVWLVSSMSRLDRFEALIVSGRERCR